MGPSFAGRRESWGNRYGVPIPILFSAAISRLRAPFYRQRLAGLHSLFNSEEDRGPSWRPPERMSVVARPFFRPPE